MLLNLTKGKMDYNETIQYIYDSAPMFQKIGVAAFKPGLGNSHQLDEYFNHPHRQYKTIHVGGTNGKGSCSHTLAAVLQSAGYRVGLYTSPHLIDFRERIRVNGEMISKDFIVEFINGNWSFIDSLSLSFFELTTALAFRYFAHQQVDIAIIEVGLGGKFDSTNIIQPDLAVITNISLDHTHILGHSLAEIAGEKAGIIKADTPVVIGETTSETKEVFAKKASECNAPIVFAEDNPVVLSAVANNGWRYETKRYQALQGELGGYCQTKNANTVLVAIEQLQRLGYRIDEQAVREGFANVCKLTNLMGRWQTVSQQPRIICDTGHNVGGMQYIVNQLENTPHNTLHFIIGMVNDKDIASVLQLLPKEATYYFTKASVERALSEVELKEKAEAAGLKGESYPTVAEALEAAKEKSLPKDLIFVGGSTFIVADLLAHCNTLDFH